MKIFRYLLLFTCIMPISGCTKTGTPLYKLAISPTYDPYDPMDAQELAKTHPSILAACRAAGSCSYIVVSHDKIEGMPIFEVTLPDPDGLDLYSGAGPTLDTAAAAFMEDMRTQKAMKAYGAGHPRPATSLGVQPCDLNCR